MREIIGGSFFKSTYGWRSLASAFLLLTLSHCADQPTSPEHTTQAFPTALEEQEHLNPLAADTLVSGEGIVPMTNKQLSPKEQKRLRKEQIKQRRRDRIQKIKSNFSQLLQNLQKRPIIFEEDTMNTFSTQREVI